MRKGEEGEMRKGDRDVGRKGEKGRRGEKGERSQVWWYMLAITIKR